MCLQFCISKWWSFILGPEFIIRCFTALLMMDTVVSVSTSIIKCCCDYHWFSLLSFRLNISYSLCKLVSGCNWCNNLNLTPCCPLCFSLVPRRPFFFFPTPTGKQKNNGLVFWLEVTWICTWNMYAGNQGI